MRERTYWRIAFAGFVLAVLGGGIVGGVAESRREPTAQESTVVTVVETSVLMDGGAFAVVRAPSGSPGLLAGNWFTGQKVPAYAVAGTPEGVTPADSHVYAAERSDAQSVGNGIVGGAAFGLLIGIVWFATVLIAIMLSDPH